MKVRHNNRVTNRKTVSKERRNIAYLKERHNQRAT